MSQTHIEKVAYWMDIADKAKERGSIETAVNAHTTARFYLLAIIRELDRNTYDKIVKEVRS